jgi:hypothetical protein
VKRRVRTLLRRDGSDGAREVVAAPLPRAEERSRRWNLWELEQVAGESGGQDPERDEERALLLLTLRQYAASSGELPREFDPLVRDVFGSALSEASTSRQR